MKTFIYFYTFSCLVGDNGGSSLLKVLQPPLGRINSLGTGKMIPLLSLSRVPLNPQPVLQKEPRNILCLGNPSQCGSLHMSEGLLVTLFCGRSCAPVQVESS